MHETRPIREGQASPASASPSHPSPPEARHEPGSRIGRYVVEGVIGSGAMGVVYRAQDAALGRPVAIKTIREELISENGDDSAYRRRFFREASIFGSLSHPGIVTLYDVGETDDGIPFLAMEYVTGASLAELLARGERLSLDQIMWIMAQLASAVDYAHGQDVIHRDIKPSNILVGEGEEIKLADFGVAKMLGSEFTRSQTRFGTPGYMSPEQVLGEELTKASDMFSVAAVAFELLSRKRPFPGKDVHAVLYKLVHADPVRPAGLAKIGLVTAKWRDVFGKALAKEPSQRFATAAELVSALVEILPGSWLGHVLSEAAAPSGSRLDENENENENGSLDTMTLWSSASEGGDPPLREAPTRPAKRKRTRSR